MQSLKSTAFAVTLLAISFGLYCVSTTTPAPEAEMEDLVQIDSSLSTSKTYTADGNQVTHSPMVLPSADINTQPAPIQISTESYPTTSSEISLPSLSSPQLPTIQAPTLSPPKDQFSNSTSSTQSGFSSNPQITLPPISNTPLKQPKPIQLPEIATRQPVSTSPATRDEGLINALSNEDTNQFGGSFKPQQPTTTTPSNTNDNSFNTLATAVDTDNAGSVKSADGSLDLSKPAFGPPKTVKQPPVSIASVWIEVDRLVAADEYRKALGTLSKHYGRKGLTGPQQQKLQGWLDALAGKVIYSTEHHFVRQPYVVQRGETLESISKTLKVPAEVIYNINRGQFGASNEVAPGMELKVINGPFHAEVNLESKTMTLFVKNLYAGRFPVAVGISGNPGEGNYRVMVKSPSGYTWRDSSGKEYAAGTPGNGYGPYWIGLTGSLCVHAVPEGTPHGHRGCIGLSETDAKDIFGILSKESQISLVR